MHFNEEASSKFDHLLFQMKQYKGLTKTSIQILPSTGQTEYTQNSRTIFTLPYAPLISLEDLALHFDFEGFSQLTTPENLVVARIIPPKDVALLISELTIQVNGQTVQHLTQYFDIVNIPTPLLTIKLLEKFCLMVILLTLRSLAQVVILFLLMM